jgi:glycine/sarcosine N-methyltransferase
VVLDYNRTRVDDAISWSPENTMYDSFSTDYDRFVNWPGRLAVEMPFLKSQLQASGASRVLDAACGTGMHAVALAQEGYTVAGTDLSAGMIERARANAAAAQVEARFEAAGFGELSARLGSGFDAVLCLGNSLPHALGAEGLASALADFAACLRKDGLVIIQNRNFDAVLDRRERWMEPQAYRDGDREWVFLRFYDFEDDGTLTFNLLTLQHENAGPWAQRASASRLHPLRQAELSAALAAAGFREVTCYGGLSGAPFDAAASSNLVATARAGAA